MSEVKIIRIKERRLASREWLNQQIDSIENSRFHGRVEISFEAGIVTVLRKEESLKPPGQ